MCEFFVFIWICKGGSLYIEVLNQTIILLIVLIFIAGGFLKGIGFFLFFEGGLETLFFWGVVILAGIPTLILVVLLETLVLKILGK